MAETIRAVRGSSHIHIGLWAVGGLLLGFGLLSGLSLLAFSRLLPWMRAELKLFDVASEANLWTWANVAVLVSAANIHLACAFVQRRRGRALSLGWVTSGGLLLALSLDDLVGIHERMDVVGRSLGGGHGFFHFAWVVPGAAIAAIAGWLFLRLILQLVGWPRICLASGVSLFFFGAIALEAVSGWIFTLDGPSVQYVIAFHIEEMAEAIGASLMLCAGIPILAVALDAPDH